MVKRFQHFGYHHPSCLGLNYKQICQATVKLLEGLFIELVLKGENPTHRHRVLYRLLRTSRLKMRPRIKCQTLRFH